MTDTKKLYEWYRLRRSREFMETCDKESAWANIQAEIKHRQRMRLWQRWGSIAATVLIIGGAGWWWTAFHEQAPADGGAQTELVLSQTMSRRYADIAEKDSKQVVSVPAGAEYSENLADGTKVIINASTTLSYPKEFEGSRREVELSGEAYFEVAHDDSAPFVVTTAAGTIEVLGTHFNVVADSDRTTVTLAEGSVRLRFSDREFLMKPGEQACMHSDGTIDVRHVNTQNYTSWSTGIYDFTDASLDEIARQMSLWYGVRITIADDELADSRYTGVIMRSESLQNALNMLTTVSDLQFEVSGKTIEIKSKQR